MSEMNSVFEEIRKTHEKMKEYVDKQIEEARKNGQASAETTQIVERVNSELTELRKQYDELRVQIQRPSGSELNPAEQSPEVQLQLRAFEKFLRYGAGENGRAMMSPEEQRALSSASDKDGGFLVPPTWESQLIMQAYDEAEIRSACTPRPTGRDTVIMPAISKPVVGWGRTNVAVTPQQLSVGGERITIYPLRALTLIHNDTLDDSEANIWAEAQGQFSMAIGEAEDDAHAVGAGDNSPKGIVSDSRVQARAKNTGVAAGLTDATHNGVDAMIQVFYGVKKTYRRNGRWAFNSTFEAAVRTLKNDQGDYLWQPPVQAGAPAVFLGKPIINPESMPDIAAGTYPAVFGDFARGYAIRDRAGMTVQRLVEKYAEFDHVGFLIKRRTGGQVILAEAFCPLKVAA